MSGNLFIAPIFFGANGRGRLPSVSVGFHVTDFSGKIGSLGLGNLTELLQGELIASG
jgi:hypothetical protein